MIELSYILVFPVKVLVKKQILREKKQKYVHREKEVLLKLDHPFFIKLHFTFQDEEKLCMQLDKPYPFSRQNQICFH